jgi:hypothetical protein
VLHCSSPSSPRQGYTCEGAAGPAPAPAAGGPACASNPCLNGGQCADSTTDLELPAGTYKCTCAFDRWFGDNCETTEDDCTHDDGTQTCADEQETCTDCARMMADPTNPNGYQILNPKCRNGYTCEAAAAPAPEPAGLGGQCTDNGVCTDQLQAYFATNPGAAARVTSAAVDRCRLMMPGTPSRLGANPFRGHNHVINVAYA